MTTTQIRAALRAAFGDRNYRITGNGEIHVFGRMPNTNAEGWHLYGVVGDPTTEVRIEQLAA